MKKILLGLVVLVLCAGGVLYFKSDDLMSSLVSSANMSVDELFEGSLDKMAALCENPKVQEKAGLSEDECVEKIYERESVCLEQASERWPETLKTAQEIAEAGVFYSQCLLDRNPTR